MEMYEMNIENKKVVINPLAATVSGVSKDGSTAKVEVFRIVENKMYGKRLRRKSVLLVDTAGKTVAIGDSVRILTCRRMSARKSWKVVEVTTNRS
jgi:ribosomal protein S17